MGTSLLRRKELMEALGDPECAERWSVVNGAPVVVADLRGLAGEAATASIQRLDVLAAVTVGIVQDDSERVPGDSLASSVDVLVSSEAEAERVAECVAAHPLASLALVQLLRRGGGMAVEHAILAESAVYSMLQAGPEFADWCASATRRPREPSREPAVRVIREGDVVELRLNRPERRNAFSAEMRDALCEALRFVVRDESVREARLTGEGPAFSSGGDLDEFGTLPDPATAYAIRATRNAGLLLVECGSRVHASVHGACIGAGIELPAFCNRVTAHEDAFFALPELSMGLIPGAGGTASLPRRIGRQRTAWMALTGARVDAKTALEWGLIDAVVPVGS